MPELECEGEENGTAPFWHQKAVTSDQLLLKRPLPNCSVTMQIRPIKRPTPAERDVPTSFLPAWLCASPDTNAYLILPPASLGEIMAFFCLLGWLSNLFAEGSDSGREVVGVRCWTSQHVSWPLNCLNCFVSLHSAILLVNYWEQLNPSKR